MMRSEQMPVAISRGEKRGAGRTELLATPLHVRMHGVEASGALIERARERASRKLGRFAYHLTRITVRIEDDNGPKGGGLVCRIKVVLPAAPTVVVAARAEDAYSAFDRALEAAAQAVSRSLERRRRGVPSDLSDELSAAHAAGSDVPTSGVAAAERSVETAFSSPDEARTRPRMARVHRRSRRVAW